MSYQNSYSVTEQERLDYIRENGERLAETIVDTWLEDCPVEDMNRIHLRNALRETLAIADFLSEFELARWAAALVGNEDYKTWREQR